MHHSRQQHRRSDVSSRHVNLYLYLLIAFLGSFGGNVALGDLMFSYQLLVLNSSMPTSATILVGGASTTRGLVDMLFSIVLGYISTKPLLSKPEGYNAIPWSKARMYKWIGGSSIFCWGVLTLVTLFDIEIDVFIPCMYTAAVCAGINGSTFGLGDVLYSNSIPRAGMNTKQVCAEENKWQRRLVQVSYLGAVFVSLLGVILFAIGSNEWSAQNMQSLLVVAVIIILVSWTMAMWLVDKPLQQSVDTDDENETSQRTWLVPASFFWYNLFSSFGSGAVIFVPLAVIQSGASLLSFLVFGALVYMTQIGIVYVIGCLDFGNRQSAMFISFCRIIQALLLFIMAAYVTNSSLLYFALGASNVICGIPFSLQNALFHRFAPLENNPDNPKIKRTTREHFWVVDDVKDYQADGTILPYVNRQMWDGLEKMAVMVFTVSGLFYGFLLTFLSVQTVFYIWAGLEFTACVCLLPLCWVQWEQNHEYTPSPTLQL